MNNKTERIETLISLAEQNIAEYRRYRKNAIKNNDQEMVTFWEGALTILYNNIEDLKELQKLPN